MPVSPSLVDVLKKFGHEGVHAYSIGHSRTADIDLLELARREQRVVITADLDFPRISSSLPHPVRALFCFEVETIQIKK